MSFLLTWIPVITEPYIISIRLVKSAGSNDELSYHISFKFSFNYQLPFS
jgi:hypothetical protein